MRARPVVPFRVVRVEPPDGARGVLRDDPILLLLSGPVDADRLGEAMVELREAEGALPSRVESLAGGRVLVLRALRRFSAGREHRLRVEGLRDALGHEAPPLDVRFVTGPVAGADFECG